VLQATGLCSSSPRARTSTSLAWQCDRGPPTARAGAPVRACPRAEGAAVREKTGNEARENETKTGAVVDAWSLAPTYPVLLCWYFRVLYLVRIPCVTLLVFPFTAAPKTTVSLCVLCSSREPRGNGTRMKHSLAGSLWHRVCTPPSPLWGVLDVKIGDLFFCMHARRSLFDGVATHTDATPYKAEKNTCAWTPGV
jgi:hypothetical protein